MTDEPAEGVMFGFHGEHRHWPDIPDIKIDTRTPAFRAEDTRLSKDEPAPPGKTRLADGSLIDSIDRIFVLAPVKEDPRVLSFGDGKTFYTRDKHGALRRLTPKGKK